MRIAWIFMHEELQGQLQAKKSERFIFLYVRLAVCFRRTCYFQSEGLLTRRRLARGPAAWVTPAGACGPGPPKQRLSCQEKQCIQEERW